MHWWTWLLIVVAAGVVGMFLMSLPDLLRYLRISRM